MENENYHFYRNFRFKVYATFKVRKFESLFFKINTCMQKNYHLYWTAGRVFAAPFSMLFPKALASCGKKNWNNFCCHVLLVVTCMSSKDCLRFLKSSFKLEILIFLSFLVDMFNGSTKKILIWPKTSAVRSETLFSRKAIGN